MKFTFTKALVVAVVVAGAAIAGPWDFIITQLDQFGSGSIPRVAALPAGGQPGFLVYDPGSNAPKLYPPGSSVCISGGVVSLCPGGTSSQVVLGDGTLGALPSSTPFNFGAPVARTLSLSTSYQATNTAKAAEISISPRCSASLSLAGGNTCEMELRMHSAAVTCSTGTVAASWVNGNTGTLTIGLNTQQNIGSPYKLGLPIGWHFILCPISGTYTTPTVVDQSAG